jgi:hypothetical protein
MQSLTCPIPDSINPLQSNGFLFSILKLPEIEFFCQEVNIPDLILPMAEAPSPLVVARIPGDKPMYSDLTIQFMIDDKMDNYVAVHNWLVGMGFPESWNQYSTFINDRTNSLASNETAAAVSDGVLQVLNSSNNPVRTIRFVDMFPTSLSSLQLQSSTQDTTYLVGQATFGYTLYKFE